MHRAHTRPLSFTLKDKEGNYYQTSFIFEQDLSKRSTFFEKLTWNWSVASTPACIVRLHAKGFWTKNIERKDSKIQKKLHVWTSFSLTHWPVKFHLSLDAGPPYLLNKTTQINSQGPSALNQAFGQRLSILSPSNGFLSLLLRQTSVESYGDEILPKK